MSAATRLVLLASVVLLVAACDGAPRDAGDPGAGAIRGGAAAAADEPLAETAAESAFRAGDESVPVSVVSLIPALTDWLVALGAADRLVARTDYDRQPELAHLPSVGGGLSPSIEWLASRRPELVIAWADVDSHSAVRRLADIGIPVYATRFDDLTGAEAAVREMARRLGMERQADSLLAAGRAELDDVTRSLEGVRRPGVFWLVSLDPATTAGGDTFLHELIGLAGAHNVFGDLAGWPAVGVEEVLRRQPEIIITHGGREAALLERLRRSPGWREMEAVRAGRVHAVDPDVFHRPGPGLPANVRALAELIHGGAVFGEEIPGPGVPGDVSHGVSVSGEKIPGRGVFSDAVIGPGTSGDAPRGVADSGTEP